MEVTGFFEPPSCIRADSFLGNMKEEAPGVIVSHVDLINPVYALVPTIKLEPDTDEIDAQNSFIEIGFGQGTVSSMSASRQALRVSSINLVPDFVSNFNVLTEKSQSSARVQTGKNSCSDLEVLNFENLAQRREFCSDGAEFNAGMAKSVGNEKSSVATNIMRELSRNCQPYVKLVDIFANSRIARKRKADINSVNSNSMKKKCKGEQLKNKGMEQSETKSSARLKQDDQTPKVLKRSVGIPNPSASNKRMTRLSGQRKDFGLSSKSPSENAIIPNSLDASFGFSVSDSCMPANPLKLTLGFPKVVLSKLKMLDEKIKCENISVESNVIFDTSLQIRDSCKEPVNIAASILNDKKTLLVSNDISDESCLIPNAPVETMEGSRTLENKVVEKDSLFTVYDEESSTSNDILAKSDFILDAPVKTTEDSGTLENKVVENDSLFTVYDEESSASKDILDGSDFILDAPVKTAESSRTIETTITENNTQLGDNYGETAASNGFYNESDFIWDTPVGTDGRILKNVAVENNTLPIFNHKDTLSASNNVPNLTFAKEQPNSKSKTSLKKNEPTSKVKKDNVRKCEGKTLMKGLNNQQDDVGLSLQFSRKNLITPSLPSTSPSLRLPRSSMRITGNSAKRTEEFSKTILSRRRQAVISSLLKPIEETKSRNISLEANCISDATIQIKDSSKAPKKVAVKKKASSSKKTLLTVNDVSNKSNHLSDKSVETSEGGKTRENAASENSSRCIANYLENDATVQTESSGKLLENIATNNTHSSKEASPGLNDVSEGLVGTVEGGKILKNAAAVRGHETLDVPKCDCVKCLVPMNKKQLPSVPERTGRKCDLPLPSKNMLTRSNLGRLLRHQKQKSTSRSINSESISSQFVDSIKNSGRAKQSKAVFVKEFDLGQKSKFLRCEQASKVSKARANILNLPAKKMKAVKLRLKKSIKKTEFRNKVDVIGNSTVQTEDSSKRPANITAKNKARIVNGKGTSLKSNIFPKYTWVNKKQLKERIASFTTIVFDEDKDKDKDTTNSSALLVNNEVLSVTIEKQLENAKSLKQASNCSKTVENLANSCIPTSTSSKKTSLTFLGNPKPIALFPEQWRKMSERFYLPVTGRFKLDNRGQNHSIFANEKVSKKTVTMLSSEGEISKEKLYFISGKGWVCERCEEIFRESYLLEDHKKGCLANVIICSHCPRTFEALSLFKSHTLRCQMVLCQCPECPRTFYYEHQYDNHYSLLHGKEETCTECKPPKNFKNKILLRRHIQCVHKVSRVTCTLCGQVLRSKSVQKHMRSHNRKNVVCIHCGAHFFAQKALWFHWKTHNDTGNPAAIMCKCCGKFFELKTELVKHLKVHEKERSFICEHCGKGFFNYMHLHTHLFSHKEKQFICPKCNRGFVLKHQLAAHLRTIACGDDNAATPLKWKKQKLTCANCNKGFLSKHQLIIHLSTVPCGENELSVPQKVGRKKKVTEKLSQSSKNLFTCANCNQNFICKRLLVSHFASAQCTASILSSLNEINNVFEISKKANAKSRDELKNQSCTNCGISFGNKHQLHAHIRASQCGSDAVPSRAKATKTKRMSEKDLVAKSEKHFISVFEDFVQKRQSANHVNSVPCSKDLVLSIQKPISRNNTWKKKTDKSKLRKKQYSCAKCGLCFFCKRDLKSHLISEPCGNDASSFVENTKNKFETVNKRQKLRSVRTNQLTCKKCGEHFVQKRQLATHLSSAVCSSNVTALQKKRRNGARLEKKEKKSKSAPEIQFICANCNQGFILKRKLIAHLSVGPCMSHALTVSKKTKKVDRQEKKEEKIMLTKDQLDVTNNNQACISELSSPRNNVLSSSRQTEEPATTNEKKPMPVLPEKPFVCGSCGIGFVSKQQLIDHICPAACCSLSLPPIQMENTHKIKKTEKIKSVAVPERRSVRTRGIVNEQKFSRSCRSMARLSSRKLTEEVRAKKDEKKVLRSMSAEKKFVCKNCDLHFTVKSQLNSHVCKNSEIRKAVKSESRRGRNCDRFEKRRNLR